MACHVGDLTGLGLDGVGVGESELAFNNSEFFEETPLSKADNVSEEITTVTPPQLHSSWSDKLWHFFCQYKFIDNLPVEVSITEFLGPIYSEPLIGILTQPRSHEGFTHCMFNFSSNFRWDRVDTVYLGR